MGFIEQVEAIIKRAPSSRVTMLFSATIPEEIERLCIQYMNSPEKVEILHETSTAEKIKQSLYETGEDEKFGLLAKIIYKERPDSCILFCNTKEKVDNLNERMKGEGFNCREMHGGMEQKDRLETIQSFKRGTFTFLVATDVAARGIDVDDIDLVVNYDLPVEMESYVHRIGRTGRAGKGGSAATFATPYERRRLDEIEEYIGYSIPIGEVPTPEEVENGKKIFKEKNNRKVKPRKEKGSELNRAITKIHINGGKKKKIRPGDIAGTISSIEGVNPDDIGIIDVQDTFSYVDILNGKGNLVLDKLEDMNIKGKKVRVQKALK
jgi:superfamily II DNA/RNA helicase